VEKPGKGGQPKRRLRGEAVAEVAGQRQAPTVRASHLEVLQETLDQMVADYRYCQKKVNDLPEADIWRETMLGGKIPNEWIRLRDEYGSNLQHVAIKLTQAGIADRAVRVQEAQAALLAQRVRDAAERAGLSQTQIRALGRELRTLAAPEEQS